jgi:gliding motility-associated-like protein
VVNNPAPVCSAATIDLTAASITAGSDPNLVFSYWRDAAASISLNNPGAVSASGTYYIKGTATGGCFSIVAVNVVINAQPDATITGGGEFCSGTNVPLSITLTGKAPWSITYSDGTSEKTINNINSSVYTLNVSPAATTTYTITRVSDANCSKNLTGISTVVNVTATLPGLRLPTVNVNANTPVQLNARNLGTQYTYQWTPPSGLSSSTSLSPIFNYDRNVEYQIRMTSASGCETVDILLVKVVNGGNIDAAPDLLVPNAWTPNGDGHNDKLFPFTINIVELKYFRVFNRWGQLMFETKQIGEGWDGYYKGEKQPIDAYTWIAEGIGNDGTVIRKSGNAALLR